MEPDKSEEIKEDDFSMDNSLSIAFCELALSDIQASKILFDNKFYTQALYLADQSIEKLSKAMMNLRQLINSVDDGKKYSHNKIPLWRAFWEDDKRRFQSSIEFSKKYVLSDDELSFNLHKEQMVRFDNHIKRAEGYLDKLKNIEQKKRVDINYVDDICGCINELDVMEKELDAGLKELTDREKLDEANLKKELEQVQDSVKLAAVRDKIRMFNMSRLNIDGLFSVEYARNVALLLSFAFPKPDFFRYVDKDPLRTYDAKHPLVVNFPAYQKFLLRALLQMNKHREMKIIL